MADENKFSSPPPPGNAQMPGAGKQSGSVEPLAPGDKRVPIPNPPPTSTSEPKPASPPKAAAAPPAAPAKPTGPAPGPWDSPLVASLRRQYGSGIEPLTYLRQNYIVADSSIAPEPPHTMPDAEQFEYFVGV